MYNTVKLTIRNNSDKDIILGYRNKRERVDSTKWRISDPDYQEKLSHFIVENEVSVFGKNKNKN